ncbi:MAG TPA: hypothetical protein VNW04_01360 [Puia sp.]|jgi:hypothetical protein|nr:hypothetical protein [Puia sp.]
MRLESKTICALLLFIALFRPGLKAQTAKKDSPVLDSAFAVALRQYHAYVSPDPSLYRGALYPEYAYQIKTGHPYFEDSLIRGALLYNGVLYEHIPLIYDVVLDVVVINDPYNIWKIALNREHLDSFTVENHSFVRIGDSLNPTAPRNGFYEQLYRGRVRLFRKETKSIQMEASWAGLQFEKYTLTVISYYLKKGETYYAVNNRQSLLTALKDKSSQVKKFIRSNHLRMRNDKENTLVKVITWYDGLTAR